jgi:hypothetical protein
MALGHCLPGEPRPRWRMSGWKIEYLPAAWGTPVLSHEMPTRDAAVSLAVDRAWAARNEPFAIHGPDGSSIRGDELKALLAEAR